MADKALTSVTSATTMATTDTVIANIGSAVKQISLANLSSLILKNLSVSQTLTSGTAIATINGTTIYAPSYSDADSTSY